MAHSKPISFMRLAYRGICLTDKDEVVVRDRRFPNSIPVVYLDHPIPNDKAFTFTVENSYSAPQLLGFEEHSFVIGVTTCTKDKIINGDYHLNELCQEAYDCHSLTSSIQIGGANKPQVRTVQITKSRDNLLDIVVNGKSSFYLRDRTGKIAGNDLLPFIILSGSARRIRVSQSTIEAPLDDQSQKILALSTFTSSWLLTPGIAMDGLSMSRKQNVTPLYAYFSVPFTTGKELSFTIREVDCNWNGSMTIGVTSVKPDQVCLDFLPPNPSDLNNESSYRSNWRASVNPLPVAMVGCNVCIKRTSSDGITVNFGAGSKPIILNSQLQETRDWFLFLYFGGKICKIQFTLPTFMVSSFATLGAAVPRTAYVLPELCLNCSFYRVTQAMSPCGHKLFCDGCAETRVRFCLVCDRPVDRN